jgi:RimJ/RimL family protein N-acetyltransferase
MSDRSRERSESVTKADYSVFIAGETIDLCVPSRLAIERDGWADWFNDAEITADLDQGTFPVTADEQEDYLASLARCRDRLVLLLCTKPPAAAGQRAIGVISLSRINLVKRSADIAVVLPTRTERPSRGEAPPLRGLEAMALMTAHGFERLGLERIAAGQVLPGQRAFNHRLGLLGYRAEGFFRRGFAKGRAFKDVVRIACLYDSYRAIAEQRGGRLWPGNETMHRLIRALPKVPYADILAERMAEAEAEYFDGILYA